MTIDNIYNAAVLVQTIIEENDRLREENYRLKQEAEEHRKNVTAWVSQQQKLAGETIKALLNYGKQEATESSTN
jgi:hypothetical protein